MERPNTDAPAPVPLGSSTEAEDLNEATKKRAAQHHQVIKYLVREHGVNCQPACAICSMAVDLKISHVVDAPNFLVSAILPLDIFA